MLIHSSGVSKDIKTRISCIFTLMSEKEVLNRHKKPTNFFFVKTNYIVLYDSLPFLLRSTTFYQRYDCAPKLSLSFCGRWCFFSARRVFCSGFPYCLHGDVASWIFTGGMTSSLATVLNVLIGCISDPADTQSGFNSMRCIANRCSGVPHPTPL